MVVLELDFLTNQLCRDKEKLSTVPLDHPVRPEDLEW